jgi:hypothetical protein
MDVLHIFVGSILSRICAMDSTEWSTDQGLTDGEIDRKTDAGLKQAKVHPKSCGMPCKQRTL